MSGFHDYQYIRSKLEKASCEKETNQILDELDVTWQSMTPEEQALAERWVAEQQATSNLTRVLTPASSSRFHPA